ncbi:MAG: DUF1285 domain-containing protein [Candidatus Dadabacteria bacterium]|nr:MAG: DUF1285 domain-containing protein [Candidatus Dadabacteria bacterium]
MSKTTGARGGPAGFWPIGGYRISFRRDGRWYADDEPIENRKIAKLFSQHVCRDEDGAWQIDLGVDRQRVEVEDTPLVVVSVDGDPDRGFTVRANDDISSPLDCSTLCVGEDHVLYCQLDRGERGMLPARLLRPAYYQLAAWIEEGPEGPELPCRGRRYPLRPCPGASPA